MPQFRAMKNTTKNNDPREFVGVHVRCTGAAGFGRFEAYIKDVDLQKGMFLVNGGDYNKDTWKTARLCSLL